MADEKVDLKKLFDELDAIPLSFKGKCKTASLLDENDPDGLVALRSASGAPLIVMPREVYDEILEYNKTRASRSSSPRPLGTQRPPQDIPRRGSQR